MSMFELEFMQRALIAGLLTGLSAPAIGTYLVQRRLSLMGDGIGHIAITGVALGLLTGSAPVLTAVLVSIAGATAIELVRARGKATGDVALALLFYGGIAGGVLLIGLASDPEHLSVRFTHHRVTERPVCRRRAGCHRSGRSDRARTATVRRLSGRGVRAYDGTPGPAAQPADRHEEAARGRG